MTTIMVVMVVIIMNAVEVVGVNRRVTELRCWSLGLQHRF